MVTLLYYYNYVPHVVVRKVNPEVGLILSPTQAPLYQAPEPQQTFWERDLVRYLYTNNHYEN